MKIDNIGNLNLEGYIFHQIKSLFPIADEAVFHRIKEFLPQGLGRYFRCINEIQTWEPDCLDVLHSAKYCIFLYYLSNSIWTEANDTRCSTLLFLLNKSLNGADIFYEIDMPEVFCLGHSTGIVLAKAKYSNYLVLHQGVTIGKSRGEAPILGEGVILYPNSTVIGRCQIGDRAIISPGVHVLNKNIPGSTIVFSEGAGVIIKKQRMDYLIDIFR